MENCGQGEPAVRPRRTFRRWLAHFGCEHHWVWVSPGDGRLPWSRCTFCEWSYIDDCDRYGHDWQRIDLNDTHWFRCIRKKCGICRTCKRCSDGTIIGWLGK